MDRFQRFAHNAGTLGIIQTVIVAIVFGLAALKDLSTGDWIFTLPPLIGLFVLAYFVRGVLVNWRRVVQVSLMIAFAAALITVIFFSPTTAAGEPLWWRVLLSSFVGLYMGCFFWLFSDPRILVLR